jgi:uncharacterized protein DUF3604
MYRAIHKGKLATACAAAILLSACGQEEAKPPAAAAAPAPAVETKPEPAPASVDVPQRNLYWGDTHLHTSYSPDAFLMQNRSATPDTAYQYARGAPVIHPLHRARVQIETPLDFLVFSDHAEFMGVVPKILQGDPLVTGTPTGKRYQEMAAAGKEIEVFGELIAQVNGVIPVNPDLNSEEVSSTVWGEIMDAADRHNDPGNFTALMGWEWSSTPGGANLHRVVIMREGRDKGEQFIPYSSLDSDVPEDLWNWLEQTSSKTGAHFIAIPHNSNISGGKMFPLQDSQGSVLTPGYAEQRMRWEPLMEVTQIKGDSETHPSLSPTDEFADFETYEHLIAVDGAESSIVFSDGFLEQLNEGDRNYISANPDRIEQVGNYIRSGLLRGLALDSRIGSNPYKFGLIGSTDSHTGLASAEENNFHGKMAIDSTPENKGRDIIPGTKGWDMGAAGLVALWAEENTRASLFDAMHRKEAYATTGPRIGLRFFGGWNFNDNDLDSDITLAGYGKGIPMGGDLTVAPKGKAPSFLIMALKDPLGANLDRVQVVKGWVDAAGAPQEKIYDVAWSDNRQPGTDGKLPAVGNTVDLKTGSVSNSIGEPEFNASWTDPEFDPGVAAFYYVRVLQIPTARHTLLDAIALGIEPEETGHPATIQERAYSSPIWYTPE